MTDDPLSLDNDGDVTLEWMTAGRDVLSISVSEAGRAAIAWRLGAEHGHAMVSGLPPEVWKVLREVLRERKEA